MPAVSPSCRMVVVPWPVVADDILKSYHTVILKELGHKNCKLYWLYINFSHLLALIKFSLNLNWVVQNCSVQTFSPFIKSTEGDIQFLIIIIGILSLSI